MTDKLLNSFVNYVKDVKPYHTKIKEFLSEIYFTDSFNVNITENLNWTLYHQNVWTRDDIGGYQLQRLCEGIPLDQVFRIPDALWPRFSLNDRLTYGQTPPGDDPATQDLTDSNSNGIPDSEDPWTGKNSSSHFLGKDNQPDPPNNSNYVDSDRTKYRVPFHQGARVYIDGIQQVYNVDYLVDTTRSFIKFAVAPGDTQHIEVQLFKVDRLFIAYNFPFDYGINQNYDEYGYDMLPYDSDEVNPLSTDSDYFRIVIDDTMPGGFQPPLFHNAVPYRIPKAELTFVTAILSADTPIKTGIGNGTLTNIVIDQTKAQPELWTITATAVPTVFSVVGTLSGIQIYATQGIPYNNGIISFNITAGSVPFVTGNKFTFNTSRATVPGDIWEITAIGPWKFTVQKNRTGTIWHANFKENFNNGQISFIIDRVWSNYYLVPDLNTYDFTVVAFDDTDFKINRRLVTEHGVVTDPIPPRHRPMEFIMKDVNIEGGYDWEGFTDYSYDMPDPVFSPGFSIGKVKKITQELIPGPLDYYAFVLTEVPQRGTYVELRIEQNGQLNPWINATIKDDMYLRVSWPAGVVMDILDPYDIPSYEEHAFDLDTIILPPGASRLIHNINIGDALIYEETSVIDELVIYHGQDAFVTNVLVEHNGVPIPMGITTIEEYFEGAMLPPDYIGIDKQRIVINLGTPQTIKVTLTF